MSREELKNSLYVLWLVSSFILFAAALTAFWFSGIDFGRAFLGCAVAFGGMASLPHAKEISVSARLGIGVVVVFGGLAYAEGAGKWPDGFFLSIFVGLFVYAIANFLSTLGASFISWLRPEEKIQNKQSEAFGVKSGNEDPQEDISGNLGGQTVGGPDRGGTRSSRNQPGSGAKAGQAKPFRTHYMNLQVAENASIEVIRGAYKYLSQKWHPDKNPNNREHAEKIIVIINRAYDVLSDPERRREHDEWIKRNRQ